MWICVKRTDREDIRKRKKSDAGHPLTIIINITLEKQILRMKFEIKYFHRSLLRTFLILFRLDFKKK